MIVEFTQKYFNALLTVKAKGDVRFYLNGICVDVDERRAIATNGHVMITTPVIITDGEPGALPILDVGTKKAPKKCYAVRITGSQVLEYVDTTGDPFEFRSCSLIDGTFPDYKKVMAKPEPYILNKKTTELPVQKLSFNPALVEPARQALGADTVLFSYTYRGLNPILVEFAKYPEVHCTLMPARW